MCGRFSLNLSHDEIQDLHEYNANVGEWIDQDRFVPRYNVAPRSQAPVVRRRDPGPSGSSSGPAELVIQSMKWGLVPHWSKHEDKTLSTTNARSDNLVDGSSGGMWASIKGRKRCAVICQGYYEWLTKGKDKLPHFTKHKDGKLMLMAGLYESVVLEGETEPLWTFTIVTTAANKEFEWLHDRQPVILSTPEALGRWLDTSSQEWAKDLDQLVLPYHDTASPLDCYQVPKEVGKVGTESPTFIEPIATRKDGIQAMFSKQKQAQSQASPVKQIGGKRKRSSSPSITKMSPGLAKAQSEENDEIIILDSPSISKRTKNELSQKAKSLKAPQKQSAIESEAQTHKRKPSSSSSQIEVIDISDDEPSPSKETKVEKLKTKSPKKKKTTNEDSPGTSKITSFFQKT